VYFVCVFVSYCIVVYYCEYSGVVLMELKPNPWDLSYFNALTLLFVSFDP